MNKYLSLATYTAIPASILILVFSYVFNMLKTGLATITLAVTDPIFDVNLGSQIKSGVDVTTGTKIFGWLTGLIGIKTDAFLSSIIIVYFSVLAVFVIGYLVYDLGIKRATTIKQPWRMVIISLIGVVGISWVLGSLSPALNVAFGSVLLTLGLYFLLVSLALNALAKRTEYVRLPE